MGFSMSAASVAEQLSEVKKKIFLPAPIEELSEKFRQAKPFPHIVLDGLFPNELVDGVLGEMPEVSDGEKWVQENDQRIKKFNLRSATELGEAGFQFGALVHSADFLYMLSELTGIWNLLPDPYLQGSGYSTLPRTGFFHIHADRNTAYGLGLRRRIAVITFLNKNWKPEYGGQLELWNADATACEVVIEPEFNRTIVFELGSKNFHGVPNVVKCPEGQARRSFQIYYHTSIALEGAEVQKDHGSIYGPAVLRHRRERAPTFREIAKSCVPPILFSVLRRLRS